MKTGKSGVDIIKTFEGFKSKPYLCPAKIPTIGYGATHYGNGVKVKLTDKPITEAQATDLLTAMLAQYEAQVNRVLKRELNQNQYDALVSFTYNLGGGALSKSTLMKKVNANPCDASIKNEFAKWVNAGGVPLKGLVRRRAAESDLYFS